MFAYSEHARAWMPELRGARSLLELETLRVATYNVWFDPFELERRGRALLEVLEHESPDVLALEEVTAPFLELVLDTPWIRESYSITRVRLDALTRYDVVMLSRLPVARYDAYELTSQMGRRLHVLELDTHHGALAIGGVHLESMKQMTPTRLVQIDECVPLLSAAPLSVWMGDFNAAPGTPEDERMCASFRDAWSALESEPGYTRDTTRNAMLAQLKDDRHQRIDRIFVRSDHLVPEAIRMLGTEPLADTGGQVFPSDHFGLVADLHVAP